MFKFSSLLKLILNYWKNKNQLLCHKKVKKYMVVYLVGKYTVYSLEVGAEHISLDFDEMTVICSTRYISADFRSFYSLAVYYSSLISTGSMTSWICTTISTFYYSKVFGITNPNKYVPKRFSSKLHIYWHYFKHAEKKLTTYHTSYQELRKA